MSGRILPVSFRAMSARIARLGTSPPIASPLTTRVRNPIGSASAWMRSRRVACSSTRTSSTPGRFFFVAMRELYAVWGRAPNSDSLIGW